MTKPAIKVIVEDLEKLQKVVETAKLDKAKWDGKLAEVMDNLKDEFKIKTINGARKKLKETETELEDLEKEITTMREKIRDDYGI